MRILLSSTSELEVVLRLIFFLLNLRAIGDICFRRTPLSNTGRIGLGLGISFLAVFVGSVFQRGLPGRITPLLLYALLALGWGSIALRLPGLRRAARPGVWAVLAGAIPFLLLLVVAGTVVHADWPRWIPMTSDPQQHAFFTRKVMDYQGIPRVLAEMGGSPFNYPAGSGVLGYLIFSFSGLLPAESVSLVNGLFLLFFSLALVEAAHLARLPLAQRCLLAVIPFMIGVGGFGGCAAHAGTGRLVAFWLSQIWLVQIFLMKRSAASFLPMLAQFVLLLMIAAELNPPLAVLWTWIGLLTLLVWKSSGDLTWRRLIAGVVLMGIVFSLMIVADPFFLDTALGKVPSPTIDHLPKAKIHLQAAGEAFFVGNLARYLLGIVQGGPRKAPVILVLASLILLANAKEFLRRASPKTLLVGIAAVLFPAAVLTAMSTYFAIPSSSGANLIGPYNTQLLILAIWLAAFVLAVWSLNGVAALFRRRWLRFTWAAVSILGFSYSAVCYGIQPHLARHRPPPAPGQLPAVNSPVPPGLAETARAVAELWSKDHSAKVLFVNWEWTLSKPERWIMVEYYSSALSLLRHSNPAFFFFKGSPDYSYDNYFSRVCLTWDSAWLADRGIRWVLLPPKAHIDKRCVALRGAASDRRWELKSATVVQGTKAVEPEHVDP
jgi:hypothetical protein